MVLEPGVLVAQVAVAVVVVAGLVAVAAVEFCSAARPRCRKARGTRS